MHKSVYAELNNKNVQVKQISLHNVEQISRIPSKHPHVRLQLTFSPTLLPSYSAFAVFLLRLQCNCSRLLAFLLLVCPLFSSLKMLLFPIFPHFSYFVSYFYILPFFSAFLCAGSNFYTFFKCIFMLFCHAKANITTIKNFHTLSLFSN